MVVLGALGSHVVAEDARELLVLLAIGYRDLLSFVLGSPPDDPEAVSAVAEFREWVEGAFGGEVPQEWRAVGDDEFSLWLDVQLGRDIGARAPVDSQHESRLTGSVRSFLAILGETDGPDAAARVADVAGVSLGESLRGSTRALRAAGLEVSSDRHGVSTLWISVQGATAYPRAASLIDGIDRSSTLEQARDVLGVPERQGGAFLRYVLDGRYVHLEFADGTLTKVTLMVDAP